MEERSGVGRILIIDKEVGHRSPGAGAVLLLGQNDPSLCQSVSQSARRRDRYPMLLILSFANSQSFLYTSIIIQLLS